METGTKAKAGLAAGGVLAAVLGLMGDCGRVGMRAGRHVDDVVGVARYGDELAGAGAAAGHLDELDELVGLTRLNPGAPSRTETLGHLRSSRWDDFEALVEGGETTIEVGMNASDLLVDDEESSLDTPLPEILQTVRHPAVAAIMPPYEDASYEERELREQMSADGVRHLDAPSSLATMLEEAPRPLLIVARIGSAEGTLRAPDGSDLGALDLLTYCAAAGADCAALVCNTDDTECLGAAYRVADATLAANQQRLPDLYRALLSGRYAAGELGRFDIFRLAEGQLVRSDGSTGEAPSEDLGTDTEAESAPSGGDEAVGPATQT